MSPHLVFAPGWALDGSLWNAVLAALGAEFAAGFCSVLEPGYFSAAPVLPPAPGCTIAVGHSLGLLQVLAAPPPGLAGLVSINGFTRFSRAADHPAGIAPRVLDRMRRRLAEDADATALAFRARCGLESALPGRADPTRLRLGLDQLETADCRMIAAALRIPVRALAGAADAIAPPALTLGCFAEPDWVPNGGHLLPLTHPESCAGTIRAMLALLASRT